MNNTSLFVLPNIFALDTHSWEAAFIQRLHAKNSRLGPAFNSLIGKTCVGKIESVAQRILITLTLIGMSLCSLALYILKTVTVIPIFYRGVASHFAHLISTIALPFILLGGFIGYLPSCFEIQKVKKKEQEDQKETTQERRIVAQEIVVSRTYAHPFTEDIVFARFQRGEVTDLIKTFNFKSVAKKTVREIVTRLLESHRIQYLQALVAKGVDILDVVDGETNALHVVLRPSSRRQEQWKPDEEEIIPYLLQLRADPNEPNAEGQTPLEIIWSSVASHVVAVQALLKHGATISSPKEKLEFLVVQSNACYGGNLVKLIELVSNRISDKKQFDRAFFLTLKKTDLEKRKEILTLLIQKGADPNARQDNGELPLITRLGDNDDVRMLVAWGADVNQTDDKGKTVAQHCVEGCYQMKNDPHLFEGYLKSLQILLENNADLKDSRMYIENMTSEECKSKILGLIEIQKKKAIL